MVWACDEKRGVLRRKEGGGNVNYKGGGREEGLSEGVWIE